MLFIFLAESLAKSPLIVNVTTSSVRVALASQVNFYALNSYFA